MSALEYRYVTAHHANGRRYILFECDKRDAHVVKIPSAWNQEMGAAFPELHAAVDRVVSVISEEEDAFSALLDRGVKYFEEVRARGKEGWGSMSLQASPLMPFPCMCGCARWCGTCAPRVRFRSQDKRRSSCTTRWASP